ncbi:hypothetical protein E2C01_056266 [Portunus trituberculatus]|uniref:Uncharacterized protein n=1 Tax=Portunus trituberculatus TaxID=210409 RepID=A0A5B7GWX0_PORTR|nr:hypothetical protein [Portunus trituberculatus]
MASPRPPRHSLVAASRTGPAQGQSLSSCVLDLMLIQRQPSEATRSNDSFPIFVPLCTCCILVRCSAMSA